MTPSDPLIKVYLPTLSESPVSTEAVFAKLEADGRTALVLSVVRWSEVAQAGDVILCERAAGVAYIYASTVHSRGCRLFRVRGPAMSLEWAAWLHHALTAGGCLFEPWSHTVKMHGASPPERAALDGGLLVPPTRSIQDTSELLSFIARRDKLALLAPELRAAAGDELGALRDRRALAAMARQLRGGRTA